MNPESGNHLAKRLFELDPYAVIDSCGPPSESPPMSVIFSQRANFDNGHMQELGELLAELEYLNLSGTLVTDEGLAYLAKSISLKTLTIGFEASINTTTSLFDIPTLRTITMHCKGTEHHMYRNLPTHLSAGDRVVVTRNAGRS
jgi:hypothetical protein